MCETIARAASVSDRRAASADASALLLDEHDRLLVATRNGHRIISEPILRAWYLEGFLVPSRIAPTANNGAILLEDARRRHLVPVDDWWMTRTMIEGPSVSLASSGLQTLLDRFTSDEPLPTDLASAVVLRPTDETRRRRHQRTLTIVIFIGVLAFLATVFRPVLTLVAAVRPETVDWAGAAAATANALAVLTIASGRRRRRAPAAPTSLRPSAGPAWFRRTASIAEDEHGLVLTDGQGISQPLATPRRHLGPDAVARAVFVHDHRPRVLLLDGTDTVRSQLPLDRWGASPEQLDALRGRLHSLGILTVDGRDPRDVPPLALDEMRNSTVGVASLMSPNAVGTVPAYPLLASSAFIAAVLAGVDAAGGGTAAAVAAGAAAVIAVAVVTMVFVLESSTRLPIVPVTPGQTGVPDRPRVSVRQLAVVVLPLLGLAVGVWYLAAGNVFSAISLTCLGIAIPVVSWLGFRRRRAGRGRVPVGLGRWIVTGAPRGDE